MIRINPEREAFSIWKHGYHRLDKQGDTLIDFMALVPVRKCFRRQINYQMKQYRERAG